MTTKTTQKKITKKQVEGIIFEWVMDGFGYSEATDPSWNIEMLADYVAKKLNTPNYKLKYKPEYEGF